MSSFNRRDFLKTGLSGAAGAITLGPAGFNSDRFSFKSNRILFRKLGNTSIEVPVLSLGISRFENPDLLKLAYDSGIRLFDTTSGYASGSHEIVLGSFLTAINPDSFYVQVKVKPDGTDNRGVPGPETTTDSFIAKFNKSLSRLGLKSVDILYVQDISTTDLLFHKPVLHALEILKREKKIRYAGFTTQYNMRAVIEAATGMGVWDVIMTSYNYRTSDLKNFDAVLSKASSAGIGIIAMNTMAGGEYLDKERTGTSNPAAALKWALSNPGISTAVVGMSTPAHLESNLKAVAELPPFGEFSEDLHSSLSKPGMICSSCGNCTKTCTKSLPVSTLMRAYMLAYGYSELTEAYKLLGETGTGSSPCSGCNGCRVTCGAMFNVRERITDVSRLVNVPHDFIAGRA
jgi:predicted aldo/keto reductase-like oxidoreductase